MGIGARIDNKLKKEDYSDKNLSRKKELNFIPEEPKYSFDDIILSDHIKERIFDAANYVKNSKIVFEKWGLSKTHKYSKRMGINFYGVPGTGKTMAAHALANYLNRKILVVNYADIESKYVGETPKNIHKVFNVAKETRSILFFDEADAILSKRVTNMDNATDVSVNQTRSVMLMILNEYQDFIIFATNFIENFDSAFMRRISMHIKFELPDYSCRKLLWRKYIPDEMPNNIDFDELARKYENISGSDISTAVLNAAFKAARQNCESVEKDYIFESIEDILASRKAHQANEKIVVNKRIVTEDYVKSQIKNGEGDFK